MPLLSEAEKASAIDSMEEIIRASGLTARVKRRVGGEDLYGADDAVYNDLGDVPVELQESPDENLGNNIDATVSVLPAANVAEEDRLEIGSKTYRIQTITPHNLCGAVTHKTLELVEMDVI